MTNSGQVIKIVGIVTLIAILAIGSNAAPEQIKVVQAESILNFSFLKLTLATHDGTSQPKEITVPTFDFSFTVDAPLQAVTDFHRDTSALKKLTPPPMIVQLHDIEPMGEGSISKFTLWFGPLPIHWKAVHSKVSSYGFTDTQVEGPAKSWVHTHTFTPVNDSQTRIDEHIEYEHGGGFWGVMTRLLFAKPNLMVMFTYRKFVTRRNLRYSKLPFAAD